MRKALFYQRFTVNQTAHQSHLVYRVYMPERMESIQIHFSYGPVLEVDKDSIKQAVCREGLNESIIQEDTAIRNLLTVSVHDPYNYRGSHHFFGEDQVIELSNTTASEGFFPGSIHRGHWEFIVNCHGVFSEKVHGQVEVIGVTSNNLERTYPPPPLEGINLEQEKKGRNTTVDKNYQVKKVELHTHTLHSDALQTAEELLEQAEKEHIDWLAITDHNTTSALMEAGQAHCFGKRVNLIHGIEYTTYHGHFLVHGSLDAITQDWTKISKNNIQAFFKNLKEKDTYLTIAHPFDAGNPFCTGCRWEYVLENVRYVDAIEVWNGTNPHQSISNEDAFQKWTQLLAQGYEIAASCGRDWHQLHPNEAIAYTYLILPEQAKEKDVIAALALGRSYCSIRPQIDFKINGSYQIGDRLKGQPDQLSVILAVTNLKGGDEIRIYTERHLLYKAHITDGSAWGETIQLKNDHYKLVRVEVHNEKSERVAFTNPIYIDCD
ncbi:CehA/McbA family metallohydrolase [Oceanobacillus polygoni]|uniref:Metal-dependent phosphoesterase TrpH n=1 Tax=Oceanobacillus polygoni TaxID=1235259 RepID=A0A9X0YVH3_9BACI|nr:CehA/McbA family metallohydrolase [Oceanobacillus polygoni]MBP2079577.1 putative metal-dependent phosphoesterase TrpH [Oceanobacillus polygoni]